MAVVLGLAVSKREWLPSGWVADGIITTAPFTSFTAWPVAEIFRGRRARHPFASAVQVIVSTSALYEIAEWLVASSVAPELGVEFIGAQGDVWDAQKDMAAASIGALLHAALFHNR